MTRLLRPVECAICARILYQIAFVFDSRPHQRYCGRCADRIRRHDHEAGA